MLLLPLTCDIVADTVDGFVTLWSSPSSAAVRDQVLRHAQQTEKREEIISGMQACMQRKHALRLAMILSLLLLKESRCEGRESTD